MEDTGSDYESSVEYRIKREKLYALISATNSSKYMYSDHIESCCRGLNAMDTSSSLLLDAFHDNLWELVNSHDCCDDYDSAVRRINNVL